MEREFRYSRTTQEIKSLVLPYYFEYERLYPNDLWRGKVYGKLTDHMVETIEFRGMFREETECVVKSDSHNDFIKEDWFLETQFEDQKRMKESFQLAKEKALEFIKGIK